MLSRKIVKRVVIALLLIFALLAMAAEIFLLFWPSLGKNPTKEQQVEYGRRSDAFYDGVFHTPEKFELIVETDHKSNKNTELTPEGKIPVNKITELPKAEIDDLTITWFGHSTSLLQIHGMTVLIDPVLSEYSSPVGFIGAKRMAEVPMPAEDIPEIDVLLISHDHYDHLDYQTIKDIDKKVNNYCVPLGVENHLERWGVDSEKIHTMAWWEDAKIDGLTISSTPSQHYSGRLPWGNNLTLWSSYFIQDEYHKVYYTGDTGYGEFFKDIRSRYGEPELVLSEDGQYDQEWPYCHMSPEEVLKAAKDIGTEWLIPVHWAGFVLSRHAWDDPAERLTTLAVDSEIAVSTPRIGETINYNDINNYQEKWWHEVK